MDRMIYLSMTGAKATMQRQDVLAQQPGQRLDDRLSRRAARRFAPCRCRAAARATRVYALEIDAPATTPRRARCSATGRNLDVAMQGNGWLAVQGLDGTEAYTRAGALDVDAEGTLVTATGLHGAGRRRADHGAAEQRRSASRADGTVSAAGRQRPDRTSVGKLKLVTPEAPLQRGDDGLFRAADGDLPADAERARAGRRARRQQRQRRSRRWSR